MEETPLPAGVHLKVGGENEETNQSFIEMFFALLGGLGAFGAIGLLMGPLAVAFFVATVRIYRRDYAQGWAEPPDRTPRAPEPPAWT